MWKTSDCIMRTSLTHPGKLTGSRPPSDVATESHVLMLSSRRRYHRARNKSFRLPRLLMEHPSKCDLDASRTQRGDHRSRTVQRGQIAQRNTDVSVTHAPVMTATRSVKYPPLINSVPKVDKPTSVPRVLPRIFRNHIVPGSRSRYQSVPGSVENTPGKVAARHDAHRRTPSSCMVVRSPRVTSNWIASLKNSRTTCQ